MKRVWTATLIAAMAGCGQPGAPIANDNDALVGDPADAPVTPPPATPAPAPSAPAGAEAAGALPEARIDDKSAQAAARIVQRYGALLEERRFAEARKTWSDDGRASGLTEAEFVAAYDKYAEIHAEIGEPGDTEGAAGSIYVDIPLRLYGTLKTGKPFNLIGPVSLRRVNDVPGSTAEQRRWHMFQSGLKPRP